MFIHVMCLYTVCMFMYYIMYRWIVGVPGGSVGKDSACNVGSLSWKDPLEKGTATHSSILAWRIPGTEEPGRLLSMGPQRVGHYWATFTLRCVVSVILKLHKGKWEKMPKKGLGSPGGHNGCGGRERHCCRAAGNSLYSSESHLLPALTASAPSCLPRAFHFCK